MRFIQREKQKLRASYETPDEFTCERPQSGPYNYVTVIKMVCQTADNQDGTAPVRS